MVVVTSTTLKAQKSETAVLSWPASPAHGDKFLDVYASVSGLKKTGLLKTE